MTQENCTNLTSGVVGPSSSINTASVAPDPHQTIWVTVFSNVSSGTPNVPTPSLAGYTFHQVGTAVIGPFSSSVDRMTMFVGVGNGSGAINIDFSAQTQQRIAYIVDQISNTKVSGAGGADAAPQNTAVGAHASGFNVSLGAFANVNNGTYVVTAKDAVNTVVPGGSLTKIAEQEVNGSPNLGICSMFQPSNNTNPTGTFAGSGGDDVATVAAEVAFQGNIGGYLV